MSSLAHLAIFLVSLGGVKPPLQARVEAIGLPDGSQAGLWVPASRSKSPLVVWFHGGIGANNPTKGVPAAQNMAATWKDSGAFALLAPSAWPASPWWSESAVARTAALIDSAAKRKGVDASRVILAGASDGGTGALWIASKLRARLGSKLKGVAVWSCNPDVLASQGLTLPGRDLVGIPVRWTAGGKDRLYALGRIREYWTALGAAGWALETHETPVADHDLSFHAVDLALFPAWTRKTARK